MNIGEEYLEQALELARQGLGRTSPNPTVGAVLVKNDQVIGRGYHIYADRKHAEIGALEQAGSAAQGATMYVTLEPCAHHGRTGPCADALIAAGVARVVVAMEDPNPQVAGRGLARLRDAGVEVEVNPQYTPIAEKLNEPFLHFIRTGRPLVTMKSALTLDGKIAAPEDNAGWITSEKARAHVQTVRHLSDAILTGIGTVLADDCLLTDRSGQPRSRPLLRIVMDSQLRLPLDSKMVQSVQDDVLVVGSSAASVERRRQLEQRGVKVLIGDAPSGRADLHQVVRFLAEHQYQSLMIEAGSKINWGALEAGIVDRIFFYYAAKILGGLQSLPVAGGVGRRNRRDAIRFHNVTLHTIATDEFAVEAYVVR